MRNCRSVVQDSWCNRDNIAAYKYSNIELMDALIDKGGFTSNCDYKLIDKYISSSSDILDVAAGSGRALQYFLSIKYPGKVTAVERNPKFFKHLERNYSKDFEIAHADIMDFKPNKKFDLIIWMWACLCEFSQREQPIILKKLSDMLTSDGILIFDTLLEPNPLFLVGKHKDGSLDVSNGLCQGIVAPALHTYLPTFEEINGYASILEFSDVEHINYKTDTNRRRQMHVFKRTF